MIGPTAYELALPGSLKCHPVIHISPLQPYHDPTKGFPHRHIIPPPPVTIDGEQEFEVEKILDHNHRFQKYGKGSPKLFYLVKWKGHPDSANTWEPVHFLQHAKSVIR